MERFVPFIWRGGALGEVLLCLCVSFASHTLLVWEYVSSAGVSIERKPLLY
jgi:hypothetical protein